jgi:ubiquinone/menaquinone biosynthesis C-methylase UbiE
VVICALVLCHVAKLDDAIAELVRVVRPGGSVIVTDFHPAALAYGWRTAFYTPEANVHIENSVHTRQSYIDAFESAGIRNMRVWDIAVDGSDYGTVSQAAIEANGMPPLCLVVCGEKPKGSA